MKTKVCYCWNYSGSNEKPFGPFGSIEKAKRHLFLRRKDAYIGRKVEICEVLYPSATACALEAMGTAENFLKLMEDRAFDKTSFSGQVFLIAANKQAAAERELRKAIKYWAKEYVRTLGWYAGEVVESFAITSGNRSRTDYKP